MPTFRPPTVEDTPAVYGGGRGVAHRLFRHYGARARGRTVIKRQDNTYYTTDVPVLDIDIEPAQTVYMGGHVYEVTDAEATALTDAGYGAYIT